MIMFVLNGSREEATGLKLQHTSVQRLGSHPNAIRTSNIGPNARKAQAPFNAGLRFSEGFYFRVDQDERHVSLDFNRISGDSKNAWSVLDPCHVNHAKLNGHADLLGGETDALCVMHRLQHVVRKGPNSGVDFLDPPSLGAQGGMAILDNFQDHDVTLRRKAPPDQLQQMLFLLLGLGKGWDILDAGVS